MMTDRSQLADALTTALNGTFPAVMRTRSWEAYEQLHSYPSYEQWYNAELIMHLRREVHGSRFDADWVCVRGEAPIGTRSHRADWAILQWEPRYASGRCFDPKHVLAVGETKVVGLGAAGSGNQEESLKVARLAEQLENDALSDSLRFAYLVLPCWQGSGRSLGDSARRSLHDCLLPRISEKFRVEANMTHMQVITGWLGIEETSPESKANESRFALLQLLLCRPPAGRWEAVEPPAQHQFSSYVAAIKSTVPATTC